MVSSFIHQGLKVWDVCLHHSTMEVIHRDYFFCFFIRNSPREASVLIIDSNGDIPSAKTRCSWFFQHWAPQNKFPDASLCRCGGRKLWDEYLKTWTNKTRTIWERSCWNKLSLWFKDVSAFSSRLRLVGQLLVWRTERLIRLNPAQSETWSCFNRAIERPTWRIWH